MSAAPLLLAIDQFEEFLFLHGSENGAAFASFLTDLSQRPIKGVKLLLVFRSDYRGLVFKLRLPSLVAEENWQELSPWGRAEAIPFMQLRWLASHHSWI
jgi:hypothetical protein